MAIHKIDGGPGGENNHFPKKFVTLHSADAASNNISRGDFVRIDIGDSTNGLGASVEQSPSATASGDPLVFGIATHALAVAGDLTVQVAGKYGDETAGGGANVHTDINAASLPFTGGDSGGVGTVELYASGTHTTSQILGFSLNAAGAGSYGANECTVMLIDQGLF